jgi:hypothetical protein
MAENKTAKSNGRNILRILSFVRSISTPSSNCSNPTIDSSSRRAHSTPPNSNSNRRRNKQRQHQHHNLHRRHNDCPSSLRDSHHHREHLHVSKSRPKLCTRRPIIHFPPNPEIQLRQPRQIPNRRTSSPALKRRQHYTNDRHDAPTYVRQSPNNGCRKHSDDVNHQH